MRKTLTAVAAAATIGVATVATPSTADARWAGGALPSAPSPSGPSSAARLQGRTITAGITADILRRTRTIRPATTATTRRPTPTVMWRRPITATPTRRGHTTTACAGGMVTAIACAERLRSLFEPTERRLLCERRLFCAPNSSRAVPTLTKFRQINRMMLPRLNRGLEIGRAHV